MADLAVTHTFPANSTTKGSEANINYSDIVLYINARNNGTADWDMVSITHATNVPLTANNSTGTQNIALFEDNGVPVLTIADGSTFTFAGAGALTTMLINNTATDGDPILGFQLSGTSLFTMGVDDGDSDIFKIGTTAIGTSTRFSISSSGTFAFNTGITAGARFIVLDDTASDGAFTLRCDQTATDGAGLYMHYTGNASGTGPAFLVDDSALTFFRINRDGNVGIGTGTFGSNSISVVAIANGTVPADSPANAIQLYAADVSSSSELQVRDEAGNVTVLSPHNFTLFTPDTSAQYPWSYYARNAYVGKEINVDIYGAVREIEMLSGKQFIYVKELPANKKQNWNANQNAVKVQKDKERADKIAKGVPPNELPPPYVKKSEPGWITSARSVTV